MIRILKLCPAKTDGWPLYCMPLPSGSVDLYVDLARIIGQDRPVFGIVWKGIYPSKVESLQALATPIARLFEAHLSNGPFCLLGYSFGGHLAIETARQLAAHGIAVPLVAVVDQAPHVHSFNFGFRICRFAKIFSPWAFRATIRYLTDATMRQSYRDAMRRKLRGQQPFQCQDWYQGLSDSRRNFVSQNLALSRKYCFEGIYRGKILLLRALGGDPFDPSRPMQLEDYGWRRITGAAVDVVHVPGDHASIMYHPDVAYLGAAIRTVLNDVGGTISSTDQQ